MSKGILLRLRNTENDKQAYVLCFRMKGDNGLGDPRYLVIIQEDSWSSYGDDPKKIRVGGMAGLDAKSFARGERVDPVDFPHELVFPKNMNGLIDP